MLIGEISDQFNVTADTLRYYDRIGLLSPQRWVGLRRYSPTDRQKLSAIMKMKALMFSLVEIRALSADAAIDQSLRQAKPDPVAIRTLSVLVTAKLEEMDSLEEKLKQ